MRKIFVVLLVLTIALGLVWLGCDMEPTRVTEPPTEIEQAAKPAVVGIERAIAVQNQHTPALMAIPDVVGTAVGLGVDGTPAVMVLTKAPGVPGIPGRLDGVPVIVKVTGEIRALQVDPKERFDRPVPIGVSTGHPNITAGTIGCRVKDAEGNVYALSNNHVYADENLASIGDPVLQPGAFDGGTVENDVIGTLFDFKPIWFGGRRPNKIDAAIALSSTVNLGNTTPSNGYITPKSDIVPAAVGQAVQKYGRTTSLTKGEVTGINATVRVGYTSGTARFADQIIVESSTAFIKGGDSGSLLVTDPGCNPLGLLFAGNESGTFAVANRIDLVLAQFNVTIDGEGGSEPENSPPTADFSYTTSGLTVNFTDKSADSDGNVVAWNWDFGDGASSTDKSPSHTYAESEKYTVTLTVTDDNGATDSKSTDVSVTEQGTAPPEVTGCVPDNGTRGDRLTVAVTGSNFQNGATVDFGGAGIIVQGVSFVGSDQLDVKINIQRKAATVSRDVTVNNPDGQSGTLTAGFTVNP